MSKPTESQSPRVQSRWMRRVGRILVGLVILIAVALVAGVLWLRSITKAALPRLDGNLHLAGLSGPVTVRRDAHGVPHIEAATQQDLFMAQGYVTAQDRLWQMDAYRRNANGELAEVMGRSLIKHDVAQRVLQFRNTAQRIYDNLPADERGRLDAYARGVNTFIAQDAESLPPEFALLHYKPRPWTGVDSLSVGMMMIETLDSRFDVKLARERIVQRLHNPKLERSLYPVGSWRDHPPTGQTIDWSQPRPAPTPVNEDDEDDDRTQTRVVNGDDIHALRAALGQADCDGCQSGSNNWVIAGAHTASGKPLLSNDMHLSLTVPNTWYMADLSAPGYHAAGVTLTGFPYVIAGHNEHVAWGFTALYADVQDLYVEKLDGKNNYQTADGAWHPLSTDHEVIRVRGGEDVTLDVKSTNHGPLLNPMLAGESRPIALEWTLYDRTLTTLPIYAMNIAANWAEFSAALGQWCWPTQNVVYSDDQGHIAYHAVGRIPIRPDGIADLPIPGPQMPSEPQHAWQGYIAFDDLPNAFDPPSGFLATANARVTTDQSKYPLTDEWSDPYRIERIYKSLQGRDHLTPKDLLALQTDVYSEMDQEMGHRFAYAIDHSGGVDDRLRKAADLMRTWDGQLTTESAAASVVTSARAALKPMILEPKLGDLAGQYIWSESNFALEEIVMHANPDWLPPGYKDWDAVLTEAVRRGLNNGKAPTDLTRWRYGSWHVIDLEHPLGSFLPLIGGIAGTGPQPLSGDTITVKQVGRAFGPSQRFTMDWSNIDGSTEDIVLGESGNPFSPYFRDQWDDYLHGRTFPLPFSSAAVAAQTQHTLRLVP